MKTPTKDLLRDFGLIQYDKGKKEALENELKFLEGWNADDLIKQAIEERSHFYVKSRALMIKERITEIKQKLKKL